MALPAPKMPLPGFRLIVDNAGNYIDDVGNIRLGSEFALSRNAADPSAVITIPGAEVPIVTTPFASAASVSASFAAGLYKEIRWTLKITSGSQSSVDLTFTGSTGTLVSAMVYYPTAAGAFATGTQGAHLRIAYTGITTSKGHATIAKGDIRAVDFKVISPDTTNLGAPLLAHGTGYDTDTTHDFTGLTFTFNGASVTGTLDLWGIKA